MNEQEYLQLAELNQSTLVQILNTKGPAFKKLGIKAEQLNQQQALDLLMANPRLLKRPVLVCGKRVLTGFKEEEYSNFFK